MLIKCRPNKHSRPLVALALALILSAGWTAPPARTSERPARAGGGGELLTAPRAATVRRQDPAPADLSASVKAQVAEAYGQTGFSFEANRGQTDEQVRFLARGAGYTLFLTDTEAVFALRILDCGAGNENAKRAPTELDNAHSEINPQSAIRNPHSHGSEICDSQTKVLQMKLDGANTRPAVGGLEQLEERVNYFIGADPEKWRTDIPTFARVHYAGVYPGVDLFYYGNQSQLEYDFVVEPGADWGQIGLRFEGAERVEVEASTGDLLLHAGGQVLRQQKPLVYQEAEGGRSEIESGYELKGGGRVGFRLSAHDRTKPLIIDPVLAYSTYLGGSSFDRGNSIAVDGKGNAYVTGSAASTNFPTVDPAQQTNGGGADAFVTKINAAGTARVYSTYVGGDGGDGGNGMALDAEGNIYITGSTDSTNFPTANPIQPTKGSGNDDAFVTKLNLAGNALVYSTYLGGSSFDFGTRIAVDATGNAYVTGATRSSNFPTANPIQPTYGGATDAFVTKINAAGTALVYSTYLGGSSTDSGSGIAVDVAGNAYITGLTQSNNFPTTNPIQPANGGVDSFVTKINAAGTARVFSTYLGGDQADNGNDIAVDSAGSAYVTGSTASTNFPRANPIQPANGGLLDGFVTKINAPGTALVYSTYLGGNSQDFGNSITVDAAGNAYVTGATASINFPTASAIQPANGGGGFHDVFVTKLDAAGPVISFSTYLGSGDIDIGRGIAVDAAGNIYVTGDTFSTDFPTANPIQPATGGGDAFVGKIGSYLISGRVCEAGGNGINNITVTVSGASSASTTTDAGGNFLFLHTVPGGEYSVTPLMNGFVFSPESQNINNLNSNRDLLFFGTGPTPTPTPTPALTHAIRGRVTIGDGGAGFEDVVVTLGGAQAATTATDAVGNYSFTNLAAGGDYTVFAAKGGFVFSPPSHSFDDLNGDAFASFISAAPPTPTPTPTATATFQFSATSFSVLEGAGKFQIIVTRSGDTSSEASVEYATTDGTGNDRGDYTTAIGRLRFLAGDTAESFDIFITDDAFIEGNETVQITLSNPSAGAQVGGMMTALLTIVDNDLMPSATNPIDNTTFLVRQHYVDFLNREPDAAGLNFWSGQINACGADQACVDRARVNVSAAFFLSIEFQGTGYLVHRLYRAAFNRFPHYREFLRDTQEVGRGIVVGQGAWEAELVANKLAFTAEFVNSAEFLAIYSGLSHEQFVDALNVNTGNSLSAAERNALVAGLNGGTETRATVVRKVAEDADFTAREFTKGFVLAQYIGYLRRSPDDPPDLNFDGFDFWLAKLNQFNGDFRRAELVKAFIESIEYRSRFN